MNKLFFIILIYLCSPASTYSQQTVGLFLNDAIAENGYTLFTVRNNTYLIDNCGFVVNEWESQYNPGLSVYLLENGNLLRTARINGSFSGGGIGGRIELFSWEGELLWAHNYATNSYHQHHDIEPMPNGNILLIAWESKNFIEAIQAGRNPNLTPNIGVWPDKVVEIELIDSTGINVVWEWHMWDHLIQDFDSSKDNFGAVADHPELLDANFEAHSNSGPGNSGSDWLHCNAISYNPDLDQIVLSSRHLSEIWVIDHSTTTEEAAGHSGGNSGMGGDIMYRFGNQLAYGYGSQIDKMFFGQHDVKWIPTGYPNEGKISVFNNGQNRPGGSYSSIDIIEPPLEANGNYFRAAGEAFGPAELAWTYEADPPNSFYSSNISGAQFLPNGNVLICDGNAPRFFEVDTNGLVHWEYISPILNTGQPVSQGSTEQTADVFRATRYSTNYPAFDGKELMPGDPVELDPLPSECMIFDGMTSSIADLEKSSLRIFPNPAKDVLFVSWQGDKQIEIMVYDILGQTIGVFSSEIGFAELDVSSWHHGIYFLSMDGFGIKRIVITR